MTIVTALGLMSGTSADGIDVAVIETDGTEVVALGPQATVSYDDTLRRRIRAAFGKRTGDERLEYDLTVAHATSVNKLLYQSNITIDKISIIGFHGQTILHRPEDRLTAQIGDGALLARLLGCTVVNRFRDADVAAGGQGAPLVPLYHLALARRARKREALELPIAIVNVGGVANVTFVGEQEADLIAFDTGPGNALIDDWMMAKCGVAMDENGVLAGAGKVDDAVLDRLLGNDYFHRAPPKSLDRNDFGAADIVGLSAADGAATLTAFTAHSIAQAVRHFPATPCRWLVTGGGARNATLMGHLRDLLGTVDPVEALGWRSAALEAEAFAFLAVRSRRGLPLSLPGTTGVPRPLTGGVVNQP